MKFVYDKSNQNGNCFLMANGLGGYCSLTVAGGCARADQALLMSAIKAPNVRFNLIANVMEKLTIDGKEYILTSQQMKDDRDYQGELYLDRFVYDDLCEDGQISPATWYYDIDHIKLEKRLVMVHGENTVAVQYTIHDIYNKNVSIEVTPIFRCCPKKENFDSKQPLNRYGIIQNGDNDYSITKDNENLIYAATNAKINKFDTKLFGEMYYPQDERDGRKAYGNAFINHSLVYEFDGHNELAIIFSSTPYEYSASLFGTMCDNEKKRKQHLVEKAGLKTELAKQLVASADSYIVYRESTKGKSIIAGYPFFEDWGRDTMISLAGATLVTGRYEECKSILRTFARYVNKGLLPNLFPEGDEKPMYNSADAPLLFINAVYEYIVYSGDNEFKTEILPTLEYIIKCYIEGTDFHIKMDSDGLIMAGEGLEQLTWMDVRIGDFLPTPRHGKPVEINAYWYSALEIMYRFTRNTYYQELADIVKESFNNKFWICEQQCLKDVLSGGADENQIRCNQIWALAMPFTMLSADKEILVINKVREELYTTAGLRTLSINDKDFHGIYIGTMQERDRAYHQGTVWAFPLGAYYRACMRLGTDKSELDRGILAVKDWLTEGCAAQLAEIYDGKRPTISRGCYAQAWSVCELLRAVAEYEKI